MLSSNLISVINNGAFIGLTALQHLSLDSNQITIISNGMFTGIAALFNLLLSNNLISVINNGTFTGLAALSTLWLYDNAPMITCLPNSSGYKSVTSSCNIRLGGYTTPYFDVSTVPVCDAATVRILTKVHHDLFSYSSSHTAIIRFLTVWFVLGLGLT